MASNSLTLEHVNRIMEAALRKGQELGLAPLTVAVLDDGGHLKGLQRQDGATFFRPQIAIGKAWGAIALGMASRRLHGMGEERPMFMSSLINLSDQRLVPVPGGVLIKSSRGDVLGSVGITGDTSDNDEACAAAGIEAAGLVADCGK
jgi:uncharacterized protein GlcG (DUF336 family)